MISDEPDEDADVIGDDTTLETLVDNVGLKPGAARTMLESTEWPRHLAQDVGLQVDFETLTWFQANHANWQRQMRNVLRAWMTASVANQPSLPSNHPK